ncbi:hypothetical protein DSECCO2_33390 [anaerobic digester metagenome]
MIQEGCGNCPSITRWKQFFLSIFVFNFPYEFMVYQSVVGFIKAQRKFFFHVSCFHSLKIINTACTNICKELFHNIILGVGHIYAFHITFKEGYSHHILRLVIVAAPYFRYKVNPSNIMVGWSSCPSKHL